MGGLSGQGTGASDRNKPSCLSSAQKSAAIAWRNAATLRVTWSGSRAPGITEATDGWPSGNCSAATGSGTWLRWQTVDQLRFRQYLRGGDCIAVVRTGHRTGGKDAGGEWCADNEAHIARNAAWEFAVQYIGIQQSVRQRDQEEVDIHQIEEEWHHAKLIDTGANATDQPGPLEFLQRPEAAVVQLVPLLYIWGDNDDTVGRAAAEGARLSQRHTVSRHYPVSGIMPPIKTPTRSMCFS